MEMDASTPSVRFKRGRSRQQKKNVWFNLLLWWLQCILFCFAVEGAEAESWPNCLCSVQHPVPGRPSPARGCWWHPALSPCPWRPFWSPARSRATSRCCCCSLLVYSQSCGPSSLVRRTWGRSHRCGGFMQEEEIIGESCSCTVQRQEKLPQLD